MRDEGKLKKRVLGSWLAPRPAVVANVVDGGEEEREEEDRPAGRGRGVGQGERREMKPARG